MRKHPNEKRRLFWVHGIVTLSAAAMVLAMALSAAGWADALYILTGIEDTAIVLSQDMETSALASRQVYVSETGSSRDVALEAGQQVTIHHADAVMTVISRRERVSALLDRMNVEPGPQEVIFMNLCAPDAVEITVTEDLTYYETEAVNAPYATIRRPNEQMPEGVEMVVREGENGVHVCVYEVNWSGGQMVSRTLVQEVSNSAVDEIVEYGVPAQPEPEPEPEPEPVIDQAALDAMVLAASRDTGETEAYVEEYVPEPEPEPAPEPEPEPEPEFVENNDPNLPMDELVDVRKNGDGSGVLVFASGRTARYRAVKSMTATAYNKDEPKVGTITASGTKVHKGVVAVDRKVIPLGTRMYVVAKGYEYGYSVAEDTGVFGNVIDLYFESYKGMLNFGRRSCTVYILE